MSLESILSNANVLPTAPKVVEELIGSFDDPEVPVEQIVRTLSADPVLSAKLLRLANSAYYHVSRHVSTVDEAVRMLGFVTVRTLVISSGLVSGFKTVPGIDLRRFWRYSLHAAVGARWIAAKAGENGDLAFTVGMMHAIGQLVIHSALPTEAAQIDSVAGPFAPGRIAEERDALGFSYADVSAELALRWKFPPALVESLRAFPDAATGERLPAALHLAVWRACADESLASADELAASLPVAAVQSLGLSSEVMLRQMPPLAELSAGLEELIH